MVTATTVSVRYESGTAGDIEAFSILFLYMDYSHANVSWVRVESSFVRVECLEECLDFLEDDLFNLSFDAFFDFDFSFEELSLDDLSFEDLLLEDFSLEDLSLEDFPLEDLSLENFFDF